MATPQLTFTVNCAVLESAQLGNLPKWITDNPFGQCDELVDDSERASGKPEAYTSESLLRIVKKTAQWNVTLSGESDGARVIVDLQQRARGVTISVKVEHERLSKQYERFFDYAAMWVSVLPKVSSGYIYDSSIDIATLHRTNNIERPPACFTTHLRWVHFLAPSYYSLFLTTDDLLGTPAHKVVKADGDVVVVRNFADPFSSNEAKTLQRLAMITAYLRSKDKFMKDSA